MLDYISVEIKGYYNCIKINYYRDSNATITTSLILDFDKQFIYAMQQIARYLNSKVHVKKQYDQEQHIIAEKAEYERLHGTHRYSKQSFSRIEDDYSSKLLLLEEYSNIELLVESSVDLHLVNIDSVVTLSNNGFLINAICDVEGNDTVIGTVANKDFSDSLAGFIENKRLSIISFVSNVDELEKTVSIKIGLFFDMSVTNMKEIPHVDAKLTKTSKKDEFDMSRQDYLDGVSEGDIVNLEYQYGSYLVTDELGNELGEISESNSEKILDLQNQNPELLAFVLEMGISDSLKTTAKIRVMLPVTLDYLTISHESHADISGPSTIVSMCKFEVNAAIADKLKKHFIAFDVETTGLSPERDRIVEIGAVEFLDGKEVRRYSTLVNPMIKISPAASSVNHITNEMLQSAPSEKEVYSIFTDFISEAVEGKVFMCAHNASFDFGFLEQTLKRMRINAKIYYIDTLSLCRKNVIGLDNYKQETLEHHFGLVNAESHRAVSDAEMCGKILMKAIECGEASYSVERERIDKIKPSSDELEVCAVINKILLDAGLDLELLRFRKSSSTIDGTCFYPFISFKFVNKGRYIILPTEVANNTNLVTEQCPNSEGGIENKRVFFTTPMDIEEFAVDIIKKYKDVYKDAMDYLSYSQRVKSEVFSSISEWYSFDEKELAGILAEIATKDYSEIKTPKQQRIISRDEIIIHPVNNRVPLANIKNLNDSNKGYEEGSQYWEEGDALRKEGDFEGAIQLFDEARYQGYLSPVLYESYSMVYHKLKDYDNEIDILDEGIERLKAEGCNTSRLETRRETAIKSFIKEKEAEKTAREKTEAKKKKQAEKEAQKQERTVNEREQHRKAMLQMDDEGNVIAEYSSVTEAAEAVGISTKSIRDAANGVQKHAAGFCWKYKQ